MFHHILVALTLLSLALTTAPAQGTKASSFFAPRRVVEVNIKMLDKDWDALRTQDRSFVEALITPPVKRPFTWFQADVEVDGITVKGVKLRKKGFIGSLNDERPSLKVKFGSRSPIKGLDRLTLNNNNQDRSLLSQYLGYKIFRDAGMPAPRCNLAKVTVNGESLGIYSNVESIKPPFLEHAFGNDSGVLIEGAVADFVPDGDGRIEFKEGGEKNGRALFERLTKVLATEDLDAKALDAIVDLDEFLRFWAIESITSFWDGYCHNQNNFYAYQPKGGRLRFIPWGMDDAFTMSMPLPPYRIKTRSVLANASLPVRLYADAQMRSRYQKVVRRVLKKNWKEKRLTDEIDWALKKLQPHLHPSQEDFPEATDKIRRFIEGRRGAVEKELDRWPVKVRTTPKTPFCFAQHGQGTATFDTTYQKKTPKNPLENGKATLSFELDGKKVAFKQLGVGGELSTAPPPPGKPRPPAIVFFGLRESDGKLVILGVSPKISEFKPTDGRSVGIQGVMFEGRLGFMNPAKMKTINGTAIFQDAAMRPGAKVIGSMKFRILKSRGG